MDTKTKARLIIDSRTQGKLKYCISVPFRELWLTKNQAEDIMQQLINAFWSDKKVEKVLKILEGRKDERHTSR